MIFVTGDMHADPGRFSMENFPEQKEMTRNDYMVICGDFGLLWDKEESKREKWWLDWLAEKSYTTLVVDGNHEDFTRLNTLPEEEWNGGRVHKVRENVIHLMRGEIFDLNGKAAYIFGGARSHQRHCGQKRTGKRLHFCDFAAGRSVTPDKITAVRSLWSVYSH